MMSSPPTAVDAGAAALVVGADDQTVALWSEWLMEGGFVVATCSGPGVARSCPRADGESCILREAVDIAVVDVVDEGSGRHRLRRAPPEEALCTRQPDDAATVFVHPPERSWRGRGIRVARPASRTALLEAASYALDRARAARRRSGEAQPGTTA